MRVSFRVSWFLAWRYLFSEAADSFIKFLTRAIFILIIFLNFVWALSLMIFQGFNEHIITNLRKSNPDIIVFNQANLSSEDFQEHIAKHYAEQIVAWTPVTFSQVFVECQTQVQPVSLCLTEQNDSLGQIFVDSQMCQICEQDQGVFLSKHLFETLDNPSKITIFQPTSLSKKKVMLKECHLPVLGYVMLSHDTLDQNFVLASFATWQKYQPNIAVDQFFVKVCPEVEAEMLSHFHLFFAPEQSALSSGIFGVQFSCDLNKIGCSALSWVEASKSLLASLRLETQVAAIILILLLSLVFFALLMLIYIKVLAKRRDIVILRLMGLSDFYVSQVFNFIAILLVAFGTAIGQGLAVFVGYILNNYYPIELPEIYVTQYLPIKIDFLLLATVWSAMVLLTYFFSFFPAKSINKDNTVTILRSD